MELHDRAFDNSKRFLEFKFDEKVYSIRRNLMVASTIAVASTFIKPIKDTYEINVGVVKGLVDKPEYLSVFLVLVILYYLIWFYIHCRYLVIENYRSIKNSFMKQLASMRAREAYRKVREELQLNIPETPIFDPMGGGGGTGSWESKFETDIKMKATFDDGFRKLAETQEFSYCDLNQTTRITHSYQPSKEDYTYLSQYLDFYWRARLEGFYTTTFPIVYACLASAWLSWNIYVQLKG